MRGLGYLRSGKAKQARAALAFLRRSQPILGTSPPSLVQTPFLQRNKTGHLFLGSINPWYVAGCFTFRMPPISERKIRGQESLHLYRQAAIASIHRIGEKVNSRKPSRPIYTAPCMSIRTALQTAASSSDGSADLFRWEGKTLPRRRIGRLRWWSCLSDAAVFMQ